VRYVTSDNQPKQTDNNDFINPSKIRLVIAFVSVSIVKINFLCYVIKLIIYFKSGIPKMNEIVKMILS
jgi:hypothetical protein